MLVASIGTIKNSITKPVIRNTLLDYSPTLKVAFLRALAILLVRVIEAVSIAVAYEIIVDTLLLIGTGELRLFARNITEDFVTPIIAVVLAITPL